MFGVIELVALVLALPTVQPMADGARQPTSAAALSMAWRIERGTDLTSGSKTCSVVSLGENVTVRFFRKPVSGPSSVSVSIGFNNQPGSLRYLRIGRKIFQTDQKSFNGPVAADIVKRLKLPGELAFEWARRPDYAKRQGLFGTGDFGARADECRRWLDDTRV